MVPWFVRADEEAVAGGAEHDARLGRRVSASYSSPQRRCRPMVHLDGPQNGLGVVFKQFRLYKTSVCDSHLYKLRLVVLVDGDACSRRSRQVIAGTKLCPTI